MALQAVTNGLRTTPIETDTLIIVPLSGYYIELFELWKKQIEIHARYKLLVIALDKKTLSLPQSIATHGVIDLSGYFHTDKDGRLDDQSRRQLWAFRVIVIRHLISFGFSVISLDVDAIVVGDLNRMLETLPLSDIIAQQDFSIPMDVARKLGFIICCGFMKFQPSSRTLSFLDTYLKRAILELDDQTSLNHLIFEAGISNLKRQSSHFTFESMDLTWCCPSTSLVSRSIDYGLFIRHFQQVGESTDEIKQKLRL